MPIRKSLAVSLCLVLFLSVIFSPRSAQAASGEVEDSRPIRLYSMADPGPIGKIPDSIPGNDALIINGRGALPGQAIWSGDLLYSRGVSRVSLSLESIGQVTLSRGAKVRLAAGHATDRDGRRGLTLIGSILGGEISVKLDRAASAYFSVAGSKYAASNGADFVAGTREGRPSINVKLGEVKLEEQATQHRYTIRPVGHGSNIRVPAGGLRRIQVQVLEDDTPVPGVGVLFALDTSAAVVGVLGMGTLTGTTANVVTNAEGIAAVEFVARNLPGSSPISATIEGTRVAWTGQITVTSRGVSRGTGWTIFAIVAAGAAGGIAYALSRENDPLEAQPPTVKNP